MKRIIILTICILFALGTVGCGSKDSASLKDSEKLAISADGNEVFLDEAKYYAYSAQATNEVYYIGNKDDEIDWNEKVESGTAQAAVKGEVLEAICRRE